MAAACRQMNISPKTYYRFKKMFDEGGKAGLKPVKDKKRGEIRELSQPQQLAVMAVVRGHPDFGPQLIAQALRKSSTLPMKVEPRLISEYLKRKGLTDVKSREALGANEVDRV